MKVLCHHTPCGPHHVRTGWKNVFEALGHRFVFWDPQQKPAFDVFSEYEPDIYIGTTYELDRATIKNIGLRPELKVALFGSAWGPYLKDVDLEKYPLVVATEQEKRLVESIADRISFVFIHAHGSWLQGTMMGWHDLGIKTLGVLNAADTFTYLNGQVRQELCCDLGFVGGYWGYKGRNIDKFLLPLCHPSKGYSVKIFGNRQWPVHQYLGPIDDLTARDLFASATICPNVSEPHSTDLGWDVVERPFKVLAAGGFCISDYVEEGRELFDAFELPMAKTPEAFADLVDHFIKHPDARASIMKTGRQAVLAEHTYFDRVASFFDAFGMPRYSAMTTQLKKQCLAHVQVA